MIGLTSFHTTGSAYEPATRVARSLVGARLAACLAVVCLAGLAMSASAWAEERGHEFTASFGKGAVTEPDGVAVNEATGDVYVADPARYTVDVFNAKHELSGEINGGGLLPGEGRAAGSGGEEWEKPTGHFVGPAQVAVDNGCHMRKLAGSACEAADPSNGDVYVVDSGHLVIDKYTSAGEYIGQITEAGKGNQFENVIQGVTVAPDGTVKVGNEPVLATPAKIYTFSNELQNGCYACLVGQVVALGDNKESGFLGPGLASDAGGDVYFHVVFFGLPDHLDELDGVGNQIARIDEEPGGFAVEQTDSDLYLAAPGQVTRYNPAGELIERLALPGLNPAGAAVDAATGEVLVSDRSTNAIDVFGLEGPKAPSIRGTGTREVSSTGALLVGEINPRGAASTYQIEYGECSAEACSSSPYGSSVPATPSSVGGTFETTRVGVRIEHLTSGATYHLRVTAKNAIGSTTGEEATFTTRRRGVAGLLDGRQLEQVSPGAMEGAIIWPIGENGVAQAAASGDAITYSTTNPTERSVDGYTNSVQVLSAREPGGGWTTRDLTVPHAAPTGKSTALGEEYRFFSVDLSHAVVQPFGSFVALSEAASEQTAYLHEDFAPSPPAICTEKCDRPLVTGCPQAEALCAKPVAEGADVPAGTAFGLTGAVCENAKICGPRARAASEDLSAVLLGSTVPLTEGGGAGLYEWTAGRLYDVGGTLPEGPGESSATVSDGGSRVVYGATNGSQPLRMIDPLNGEEAQLDEGTGCAGCQSGGGERAWVSADARTAFFRDKRRLTATSGGSLGDLYVCEAPASEVGCHLTDLTPKLSGEEADVLGIVGASRDGSSVYFVANGSLGTTAALGDCTEGEAEKSGPRCNLFVVQRGESGWDAPTLVGVLAGEDSEDWTSFLTRHTASVSEDGAWLVFDSQEKLTGYDNTDATSGEPDEEVYAYHREAGGRGALRCVSCNPTGERPHGVEYGSIEERLAGGPRVYESHVWIAGSLPGWTPFELENASHDPRVVNDTGRVFFNSSDRLSARDGNEQEDVYEWEPAGTGSCNAEAIAFNAASGGCDELVSSGRSGEESGLLDASAGGDDVFFLTFAQSDEGHGGSSLVLDDAHACSAAAPCGSSSTGETTECADSASCQGAAPPGGGPGGGLGAFPTELVPGGVGNVAPASLPVAAPKAVKPATRAQRLAGALRACRKRRSKSARRACERGARRRYGTRGRASGHATPLTSANERGVR